MKYHGWAEPETPPLGDFLCGLFGGAVGFFNFPGWLLTHFGWLSPSHTLLLCLAVGLGFGFTLLHERKKYGEKS